MAWKGSIENVAIANDSTGTLETIDITEGARYLWAEIANDNHKEFDVFQVQIRPHADASYFTIASVADDFTNHIKEPVLGCSADLTSLAKNTSALLWMNVKGINSVRFRASSASASDTTADVYWSVR